MRSLSSVCTFSVTAGGNKNPACKYKSWPLIIACQWPIYAPKEQTPPVCGIICDSNLILVCLSRCRLCSQAQTGERGHRFRVRE